MSVNSHLEDGRKQLAWAWKALEFEDLRGASGRAWAAAVEATKAVAESRHILCESNRDVYRVAYDLESQTQDEKLRMGFTWAEGLRENSVEGYYHESDVELGIKRVTDYVEGVAACLNVTPASEVQAAN